LVELAGGSDGVITFSLDIETNTLHVLLDRPGIAELQAKLTHLVADGGHVHLYDLPKRDVYGREGIVEVVVNYFDDDLAEEDASLRATAPE
jgi:hypothetical protein